MSQLVKPSACFRQRSITIKLNLRNSVHPSSLSANSSIFGAAKKAGQTCQKLLKTITFISKVFYKEQSATTATRRCAAPPPCPDLAVRRLARPRNSRQCWSAAPIAEHGCLSQIKMNSAAAPPALQARHGRAADFEAIISDPRDNWCRRTYDFAPGAVPRRRPDKAARRPFHQGAGGYLRRWYRPSVACCHPMWRGYAAGWASATAGHYLSMTHACEAPLEATTLIEPINLAESRHDVSWHSRTTQASTGRGHLRWSLPWYQAANPEVHNTDG